MAYEAGAATDLDNLFDKLETFITTHGWTVDRAHDVGSPYTKQPAYHKNACFVQFRYDGSSPHANGLSCGMYQSIAFDGGEKSGNHTDDSGSGSYSAGTPTDSALRSQRSIYEVGDGPFNYWFFEEDSGGIFYVHVVLEAGQGNFRHFGFGIIDKFGDWDTGAGGEYVYGHRMEALSFPSGTTACLLDSGDTVSAEGYDSAATMRIDTFPGAEESTSKWAAVFGRFFEGQASNRDRANNQRNTVCGGARNGPFANAFSIFRGYPGFTGMVPLVPIGCWLGNAKVGVKQVFFIGWQPDVRYVNIGDFEAAEEVTIGSDTWVLFPWQKRGSTTDTSYYAGVAYKKVVA